ncbi:hypothetical protein K0M31_001113, partial [Melipona bicolor]
VAHRKITFSHKCDRNGVIECTFEYVGENAFYDGRIRHYLLHNTKRKSKTRNKKKDSLEPTARKKYEEKEKEEEEEEEAKKLTEEKCQIK